MDDSTWLEFPSGERVHFDVTCSIGRSPGNRVILPTDKVSRRHAAIRREADGTYQILDFGSSNGTFVNGQRISMATRIVDGAVLEIGLQKMIFRRTGGESAEALAPQTEAECWLLVLDSATLGARVPGEELTDKTFESWTARCERVVKKHRGQIMRALNEGLLAFWVANGADRGAKNITAALNSLRLARTQNEEFRCALHFGLVKFRLRPGEPEKPAGDSVMMALQIQRLLPSLNCSMILTSAAAGILAAEIPLRRLTQQEGVNYRGSEEFFTLQ